MSLFKTKKLVEKDHFVVIISSLEEREELKAFCLKKGIPLTYPDLFVGEKFNYFWGISKKGVGLVGVFVMGSFPKDHVCHSVKELEEKFPK